MFRSEVTKWTIGFALLLASCDESAAQRGASSSARRTGTGSIQLGQRWATPGGGAGQTYSPIPGRQSSSPAWNLRPTPSDRHSAASSYGAHTSRRNYSLAPGRVQYSQPHPHHHQSYSVVPFVQIQYQNYGDDYGFLNPYDQVRVFNGLPPQYGVNYGPVYPTIAAPPIVVPYSGFGSSATYSTVPPLTTAPAPIMYGSGDLSANSTAASDQSTVETGPTMSRKLPTDELPIVNEFGDGRVIAAETSRAVDRIRSLRYQASGDDMFRRRDYASAVGLYKAAAEFAPNRRAPLLRLAWSHVALNHYATSVVNLKTALLMADDPTSSWIDAADLYGNNATVDAALHGDSLWEWLQQRPNSTDRLLLTAAFQKLRGYSGVSQELLQAASRAGLDGNFERSLKEISTPSEGDNNLPADGPASADNGLRMKGSEIVPANHADLQQPGPPEPLSPDEEIVAPEERNDLLPKPKTNGEGLVIPQP